MRERDEFTGQLYFSDKPPHIVGQLTILGVQFAIEGHRISDVRANITARRRDGKPMQEDMFNERAAPETNSEQSGNRKSGEGTDPGATHENKLI